MMTLQVLTNIVLKVHVLGFVHVNIMKVFPEESGDFFFFYGFKFCAKKTKFKCTNVRQSFFLKMGGTG